MEPDQADDVGVHVVPTPATLSHGLRPMRGRDPLERNRVATPLELLFDLTFVAGFSMAADQASHYAAEAHWGTALGGLGIAMFALYWAWLNCTWFASAYDTDDWLCRLLTMAEMVGALVLALGLAPMFRSIDEATTAGNDLMVIGYVAIRVALVAQWLRAARQDPLRRRATVTMAISVFLAQVGWITLLALRDAPWSPFALVLVLAADLGAPIAVDRLRGGIPWHAHHVAERFGLLAIIALGEAVSGTIAAVSAVVERNGWSAEAALIVVAGTALTLGSWWVYFIVPSAFVLERRRQLGKFWSYFHVLVFTSIVAMGAALHLAAYVTEGGAAIGPVSALVATVVSVFVFVVAVFVLYSVLVREIDRFHYALVAGTLAFLILAVALVALGASLGVALLAVAAAPFVVVIGYETLGHQHEASALERLAITTGTPAT